MINAFPKRLHSKDWMMTVETDIPPLIMNISSHSERKIACHQQEY